MFSSKNPKKILTSSICIAGICICAFHCCIPNTSFSLFCFSFIFNYLLNICLKHVSSLFIYNLHLSKRLSKWYRRQRHLVSKIVVLTTKFFFTVDSVRIFYLSTITSAPHKWRFTTDDSILVHGFATPQKRTNHWWFAIFESKSKKKEKNTQKQHKKIYFYLDEQRKERIVVKNFFVLKNFVVHSVFG